MSPRVFLGGCVALLGIVLGSYVASDGTSRAGQVVFIPGYPETPTLDAGIGSLDLTSCLITPEGLRVSGHVTTSAELAAVLVSPGERTDPGVAVGLGYLKDLGLVIGIDEGDVVVTLPWATVTSDFLITDAQSLGPGSAGQRVGAISRCPESE